MTTIDIQSVSRSYGECIALERFSLSVTSGEFLFLLGPSGCGKTTLLRTIAGLDNPDSGTILFDGVDYSTTPPQERGVGLVFQNYALWPHLTVEEHLRFALSGLSRQEQNKRIAKTLESVQIGEYRLRYPAQLSGGQQQRLALARALVKEPRVLLFDEPLSNLDPVLRRAVRGELRELHRSLGSTFIYVTHDHQDALSRGDRIALIDKGRLVDIGSPSELLEKRPGYFGEQLRLTTTALGEPGSAYIETAFGNLPVSGIQPGERVIVTFPQEALTIVRGGR